MTSYKNENSIPVIYEVELLVIGGGLAGIPIAYKSADNGKRTLIIEQRTFLGYEIGAWQRPWIRWDKKQEKLIKVWLPFDEQQSFESQSIIAIHMDKYKRNLEDKLMGAAVNILYGTVPVKCIKRFDNWEVTVGNKSGRQIIFAKNIIDTTDTNILSYLLKEEEYNYVCMDSSSAEIKNAELARRTIEFTSVKKDYQSCYSVPEEIGVYGNKVHIYPGAFSEDHVLIDIPVEMRGLSSRNLVTDTEVEYKVRKISLEVGAYLVNNASAFAGARVGMGSLQVMRSKEVSFIDLLAFGENFDLNSLEKCHCMILGKNEAADKNRWNKDYLEYDINSDLEYREVSEFNKLYKFPEVKPAQMNISILDSSEVLVIGGGTGGAVAARVAAQESANTVLLEMNSALGGTGTIGGVSSYWFGNRDSFTREVDQKVRLWADKLAYPVNSYGWGPSDSWNPDIKAFVLMEMCINEGVKLYLNCITIGTIMKKDEFKGVVAATPYGPSVILSDVSIDATGDGDAAVFAGAEYLYGNQRDRMTMWASLAQYKAPGQYKNNFTTTADVGDVFDYTRFILAGRRRGAEDLYDHGSYVAPRESRHIKGEYELTLIDQLLMKSFPDTVSICFSNHDPKGKSTADIIYFGILPPQLEIEIPYRVMLPAKIDSLLIAGKAISASHDGLPAVRMQDDLQKQGGAAGMAAAFCIKHKVTPRELNPGILQEKLICMGYLSERILENRCEKLLIDYKKIIDNLDGNEPFEWLEMDMTKKAKEISPIILICTASKEEVLSLLEESYSSSEGKKRLLLARLLLWHGSDKGLDDVIDEIKSMWNTTSSLPKREASTKFCQLYPDHGVMAEPTYLINSLSRVGNKKIMIVFKELVERIVKADRDYKDNRLCMFNYVEATAYAAERLVFPEFIPLLRELLSLPEFNNCIQKEGIQVDLIGERMIYLSLALCRALARCGEKDGLLKLADFVEDNRSLISRSAQDELITLLGVDFGRNKIMWKEYISKLNKISSLPWNSSLI